VYIYESYHTNKTGTAFWTRPVGPTRYMNCLDIQQHGHVVTSPGNATVVTARAFSFKHTAQHNAFPAQLHFNDVETYILLHNNTNQLSAQSSIAPHAKQKPTLPIRLETFPISEAQAVCLTYKSHKYSRI